MAGAVSAGHAGLRTHAVARPFVAFSVRAGTLLP